MLRLIFKNLLMRLCTPAKILHWSIVVIITCMLWLSIRTFRRDSIKLVVVQAQDNEEETLLREAKIIQFVKNITLYPNLTNEYKLFTKDLPDYSQFGEAPKIIDAFFKDVRDGFFVEAGAFTGEQFSNTLWIELHNNWNGLLIEAQPKVYEILRRKNRHAYVLNALLTNDTRLVKRPIFGLGTWAHMQNYSGSGVAPRVPALNIAVLKALQIKHIDWFSLDVEGNELPVLETFPWKMVTVNVLQVEVRFCDNKGPYRCIHKRDKAKEAFVKKFMDQRGFEFAFDAHMDFVFCNRKFAKCQRYLNSTVPVKL